jgi:hypothetical protein
MRSSALGPILVAMRMNGPDATLTNGRCELPAFARGVLVLADPPESGWRMRAPSNEQATVDAEPIAASGRECDSQQACGDPGVLDDGEHG